jgi:hypothetical protein
MTGFDISFPSLERARRQRENLSDFLCEKRPSTDFLRRNPSFAGRHKVPCLPVVFALTFFSASKTGRTKFPAPESREFGCPVVTAS